MNRLAGTVALFALAVVVLTAALAGRAQARGPVAAALAGGLTPQVKTALLADIQQARAQLPDVYARTTTLQGLRPEVYLRSRLRKPEVSRELRALGPDALLPMIDVLAFAGYPRALEPAEQEALEMGLLEAIARLRDGRAQPVLQAALAAARSPQTALAAAQGLGALCGDAEIALLASYEGADARRLGAIEGLGACRRLPAVRKLASLLDGARDEATGGAAARGLASAASSWAQQAAGRSDDGPAIAAAALVRAFVRMQGPAARKAVELALLSVGYGGTPALLDQAARNADPSTRDALASLGQMLRRSLP